MAWIVKNSAKMQVPRRDEPYLTDQLKQQAEETILVKYPTRQAATLPMLHLIQETYNYVPAQAMDELADFLELPASQIYDTATFYEEYFFEPKGNYLVQVCQSISCELMGQPELMHKISNKLGVEPGQTTPDGKFTLMVVECLGSCGTAPCALVEGRLHEDITMDNFEKALDELE